MTNRITSAVAAALLAAGTVALGAPAHATEQDKVSIQVADLDLTSADGADRLERRIKSAARQICGHLPAQNLQMRRMVASCQAEAVAGASARAGAVLAAASSASRVARGTR